MIDLLLKWPDRETSVACGQALGCTAESPDDPGVMQTAARFGVINLSVIGQHSYVSDNSDPADPVITTVPGWWVLVRVPTGFDLAAALAPLGPLAPTVVWSSDMTDEEGNLVPRPPIEEAPQRRWT